VTTAAGAFGVLKSRLTANKPAGVTALRWQSEDQGPLPDTPAAFAYTEFVTDPSALVSFGGGRGNNRYRNPGRLDIYIFVPRGGDLADALTLGEAVASIFRSYRDADVSCFDATVYPLGNGSDLKPPGMRSDVGNYYCVVVEVSLFFDLIG
jgi:hypothetical protein